VGIIVARFKYSGDPSFKKAMTELQNAFADKQFSDELKRMRRRRLRNKTSITRDRGQPIMVKQLREMKLRIEGDLTHARPHLHVDYGRNRHKASYAIDSGDRLAGGLDRKYDKAVRAWIERNRKLLTRAWKAITGGGAHLELVLRLRAAD
jgi:Domain of unknown function (DUF4160)